jgi:site-specific recombinase XerD
MHTVGSPDNSDTVARMETRISDLLTSFAIELEAQGKAPRTVALYTQSVDMFTGWLADRDRPATADQITHAALRAWLAELSQTREPGTIRLRLKGLQRFCRWAVEEGELDDDPTARLEIPRGPSRPVPVLTDEEVRRLLKACAPSPAPKRNEAIVRFLADTGVRVSELTGIRHGDVNLRERTVTVQGKGGKVRVVVFASKTARALDRYLRERRQHPYADEGALWLGKRGPLTADGVRSLLDQLGAVAGVKVHPHMFRHTAAHHWLSNDGQERDLMSRMGWSSTAMLGVYGRSAADERAREAARRMAPGDRF